MTNLAISIPIVDIFGGFSEEFQVECVTEEYILDVFCTDRLDLKSFFLIVPPSKWVLYSYNLFCCDLSFQLFLLAILEAVLTKIF